MRDSTNITFNTGSNVLFGVEKYSVALTKIVTEKDIAINCSLELKELSSTGALFVTADGKVSY